MPSTRHLLPALCALALVGLSGCTTPAVLSRVAVPSRPSADLTFFEQGDARGAVTIRIIDRRPRAVQGFAEADPTFNGVLFRLSNASKLKAPQILAVPANGNVYAAAFTGIPSDAASNYFLTVGLFRNVTNAASPSDPGYADVSNKAGEGGSVGFSVAPGTTTTVTVTINAVGQLSLDSQSKVIDAVSPVFVQGEAGAFVDTHINQGNTPQADALQVHVLDVTGTSTFSTTVVPRGSWPVSGSSTVSFPVPAGFGNYQLLVEAATGSAILSRRFALFSVEQPATISVSLN